MTFSELRTQIASWLSRGDLTTAQLSSFVAMGECDIRRDLDETAGELVITDTVVANEIAVPDDFKHLRLLTIDGGVVDYVNPERFAELVRSGWTGGFYTIVGQTIKVLSGSEYTLTYQASLTALEADSDTNWLSTQAHDIYMWAGCKYGSVFLRDAAGATGYDELYKSAVARQNMLEKKGKQGGPMVVKVA